MKSKEIKYIRLSKQDFEEMHQDFAIFLASNSIDKKKWDDLKLNEPNVAEDLLDVFSDFIWENVLTNVNYLQYYSENIINLIHCQKTKMNAFVLKSKNNKISLLTEEGINWAIKNIENDLLVEILEGNNSYENNNRNEAIFKLIQQGAMISDGVLFNQFKEYFK